MNVPLLDLHRQNGPLEAELTDAFKRVFKSQRYILGKEVEDLERRLADYCNVNHVVAVSSGTDALVLSLMALGVGPGDEVITTPFTFFATAGAIHRTGARPVFVDIEPDSFNLDVTLLEAAITKKTKAIIPVHLFGQCCEMDPLVDIAEEHGIAVIEDAAQSIGSEYMGKRAGSMGDVGCFSCFPSKNLGALGDAGFVTTRHEELCKTMKNFREHGSSPKYFHSFVGGNFRMDALQAAFISIKLSRLVEYTDGRIRNAALYEELFAREFEKNPELKSKVRLPVSKDHCTRHIYNQFVITAEKRGELKEHLHENGIGCAIYYPVPLHLQKCFEDLEYGERDFPVSEKAADEVLAIPIFEGLKHEEIEYVVAKIMEYYG